MNTKSKITEKHYLSLVLAIGSTLCFSNTTLAQSFNSDEVTRREQGTFQLATQSFSNISTQNQHCLDSNNLLSSSETLLAQVIIDSRPSHDSRCSDYYTTQKNGKYYECIQCTYNREPYCWERNDLN